MSKLPNPLFLSFVIPVKDEHQTLVTLYEGISNVITRMDKTILFEIIFIDDGSSDTSWQVMDDLDG